MKYLLIASLAATLTQNAFAQETTEHNDGPCIKIMEACKAAGYNKPSATEKKSLSKNCMQPVLSGEKVEGVTINQKDLDACKLKKAEVKLKK